MLSYVKTRDRSDVVPSLILSHGLILFKYVQDTFFQDTFFHIERLKATIKVNTFLL